MKNFCALLILDGWGISSKKDGNAIFLAKTPFYDSLKKKYPNTKLLCSGEAVGLPKGFMGNSEVGHLNMGAGRIVYQDLLQINNAISDNLLEKKEELVNLCSYVKSKNSNLHIMGLLSDGGVHSHIDHLFALIDIFEKNNIFANIHAILDGRDTSPTSGINYLKKLQNYLKDKKSKIASVCGRYYSMDRDKRWERTKIAYDLLTKKNGIMADDPVLAVSKSYKKGETDEFVKPIFIEGAKKIEKEDAFLFFNFRADRARQITEALSKKDFEHFENKIYLENFLSMTKYDASFKNPTLFSKDFIKNTLGEVISKNNLKQLRIAETEKYAHVTYFFNGGQEEAFEKEERILINSPKDVPTYDLAPQMSAHKITDKLVEILDKKDFDLIVLNFANADMVGHTGNIKAAIKACETVDACLFQLVGKILEKKGKIIITADHGNAELMLGEQGEIITEHSTNPVPFIFIDDDVKELKEGGKLADIAPTILEILKIKKPADMTSESLII